MKDIMKLRGILILAVMAVCFEVGRTTDSAETLKATTPVYTILTNVDVLNSTDCKRDLKTFYRAFESRKVWSIRLLDASGSPNMGFLSGNNFWTGSAFVCNNLKTPQWLEYTLDFAKGHNINAETPPFDLHYFTANFLHNSTLLYHTPLASDKVIVLGLCLPDSCTKDEIAAILRKISHERILLFGDLYSASIELLEVKDHRPDYRWYHSSSMIIFGLISFSMLTLIISATMYDIMIHRRRVSRKSELISPENNNTSELKCIGENLEPMLRIPVSQSNWEKALLCFSIYENTLLIFNTKVRSESISVLHGIRFITMTWILMSHTVYFGIMFYENRIYSVKHVQSFPPHIVVKCIYGVDTFFFMSGFLLSHQYFKMTMKREETKIFTYRELLTKYFMLLFKRYIRITPTYIFVIAFVLIGFVWHKETSMLYLTERVDETCAKYWWANLLYINNLFARDKICIVWSWYLASDMQFYIIGCALLLLSTIHFSFSVMILFLILVGTTIISGYVSYANHYTFTIFELHKYQEDLYFAPWVRIGPYIIGMITGYTLVKTNYKLKLSKKAQILCWFLGSSCILIPLLTLQNTRLPYLTSAILFSVCRTIWGIGIAWIVIACCTNNAAGIITKILSFKAFIPLSNLSFCAYLINPYIIMFTYLNKESADHLDLSVMPILCLGMTLVSYVVGYIFSIVVEFPCKRLFSIYINSCSTKV